MNPNKNAPVSGKLARGAYPITRSNSNTATSPADKLLSRLDKVKQIGPSKWLACCPAHDDRSPSLSVKETDDQTLLVKCWRGCTASDVVQAVGLSLGDLFPAPVRTVYRPLRPGERWIPRDALTALSAELWYVIVTASALHGGAVLHDQERARLLLAAERLFGAWNEVSR